MFLRSRPRQAPQGGLPGADLIARASSLSAACHEPHARDQPFPCQLLDEREKWAASSLETIWICFAQPAQVDDASRHSLKIQLHADLTDCSALAELICERCPC